MCDFYDDDDGNTTQTSEITFDSLTTDDNTIDDNTIDDNTIDDIIIDDITLDSLDLYRNRRPSRKMRRAKKMEMVLNIEKEVLSQVYYIEENEESLPVNFDHLRHISQCGNYSNVLVEFYQVYQLQKINNIKLLLERFQNNEVKLLQLIKKVEAEYNVSLIPPSHAIRGNSYEVQKSSRKEENEIQLSIAAAESSNKYQTTNPLPPSIEEDSYDKICYQPKTKLKRRNINKNNSAQKYKRSMKKFMDRVGNVHQSAQSFLDKESSKYERYLLDEEYCQKRTTESSE